MRHYEIVLLIHPDQSEQVPAMLERYRDMVTAGKGLVHRTEDWGRRRLAYMISDVHKAHYVMLNVECDLETLRELEKNFKFNDSIVRNLVIRRARAVTEQSALAKVKAEEERMDAEKQATRKKAEADEQSAPKAAQETDREADQKTDKADKAEKAEKAEKATEAATAVDDEPATEGATTEGAATGSTNETPSDTPPKPETV